MAPRVGGRSLALTLCLNGDPTWRPATAPIARWGREIYLANQGNEKYTSGIAPLNLDDLEDAYNSEAANPPKSWKKVRHPLSSMRQSSP